MKNTGPRHEELVLLLCKQYRTMNRVLESYKKLKNALKKLHDDYVHIKGRNILSKHLQMQHMIREVN